AVNGSGAGVGAPMGENQSARPDFGERAAHAAADSAILDHPGKERVQAILTDSEVVGSEENKAVTFNRTNRHARSVVSADVQIAIVENLKAAGFTVGPTPN